MAYVLVAADDFAVFAGENVDSTPSAAQKEALELMAISRICGLSKYNVADNFAALNTDVKKVFIEYIARFIASSLIAYNMAGFTSRIEAENMLNVHIYEMQRIEEQFFLNQNWITYIKGA